MKPAIQEALQSLYGPTEGARAAADLAALLAKYRPLIHTHTGPRDPLSLRAADAMLITYADQVQAPGEPPLQTLAGFLREHAGGTVNSVHLLPFFPWTSDDGFSVQDYFAIAPEFGTWEDVRALAADFALMFDAVFNHMSAQSAWFQDFLAGRPEREAFFVTVEGEPDLSGVVRPRALPLLTAFDSTAGPQRVWTTFSADQVDVNAANPAVFLALTDALLFYVQQGARFIRLDAIAYLWKQLGTPCIHLPQTHRIIQLWRAILDEIAPQVMLITETNVPHTNNLSYFGNGHDEAQLVYNFALPPLVLHTLLTGDASKLTAWAGTLTLPTSAITFFNFLASHDGIGVNPARGILDQPEIDALVARVRAHGGFVSMKNNADGTQSPYELNINYFDALNAPAAEETLAQQIARFLCAQSIMLTLRGLPGIYFHSLFGSRGDRPAAEASGIPRRINREKLQASPLAAELAEPTSRRHLVFQGMRQMLATRAAQPAFAPNAPQEILDLGPATYAVIRGDEETGPILCLHNITAQEQTLSVPLQISAEPSLLGRDFDELRPQITLPPHAIAWLKLAS